METISLKTVYQTLHDLAELGEIASLDVGTGMTRFDPNVDDPHHHLVCRQVRKCARPGRRLPRLADPQRRRPRFRCRIRGDRLPRPVPRLPGAGPARIDPGGGSGIPRLHATSPHFSQHRSV